MAMDEQSIGQALIDLADIANCVSGDFHTMHFNVHGNEFDVMHKKVLKQYYEEAAEDYDELAEKARMYEVIVPSTNCSAERICYQSYAPDSMCDKAFCVDRTVEILGTLIDSYLKVYNVLNKIDDCYKSVGVANFLQTRIEFWSKEACYFNKSRKG